MNPTTNRTRAAWLSLAVGALMAISHYASYEEGLRRGRKTQTGSFTEGGGNVTVSSNGDGVHSAESDTSPGEADVSDAPFEGAEPSYEGQPDDLPAE